LSGIARAFLQINLFPKGCFVGAERLLRGGAKGCFVGAERLLRECRKAFSRVPIDSFGNAGAICR